MAVVRIIKALLCVVALMDITICVLCVGGSHQGSCDAVVSIKRYTRLVFNYMLPLIWMVILHIMAVIHKMVSTASSSDLMECWGDIIKHPERNPLGAFAMGNIHELNGTWVIPGEVRFCFPMMRPVRIP